MLQFHKAANILHIIVKILKEFVIICFFILCMRHLTLLLMYQEGYLVCKQIALEHSG